MPVAMADDNPGEAAAFSRFLDLLPLEVRNMIYRLAYVKESGRRFPIISKMDWVAVERNRRRNNYTEVRIFRAKHRVWTSTDH